MSGTRLCYVHHLVSQTRKSKIFPPKGTHRREMFIMSHFIKSFLYGTITTAFMKDRNLVCPLPAITTTTTTTTTSENMKPSSKPSVIDRFLIVAFVLGVSFLPIIHRSLTALVDETACVSMTEKLTANDMDHQSLFPYAYLSSSTAENYAWAGKHWFPTHEQPMGGPTFTPSEILRVFETENTLWFGDSTCRQDYHTMYGMLSSDSPNTVMSLQGRVNKGKTGWEKPPYHPPFYCPARTVPTVEGMKFRDLGQVAGTDQNCLVETNGDNNVIITDWSGFSLDNRKGKLDYLYGDCLPDVVTLLNSTYRNVVQHEYSVLILSLGVWEISRPDDCNRKRNVTQLENVMEVLDALHDLSGPSLFVVWKTHGVDAKNGARTSQKTKQGDALVQTIRDWFLRNEPKYMDLADFRLAVDERAFGGNRIHGDSEPHWGLDARLLSIDLLSRIVYRKQKRGIQK